jgi:hypothetical protein
MIVTFRESMILILLMLYFKYRLKHKYLKIAMIFEPEAMVQKPEKNSKYSMMNFSKKSKENKIF